MWHEQSSGCVDVTSSTGSKCRLQAIVWSWASVALEPAMMKRNVRISKLTFCPNSVWTTFNLWWDRSDLLIESHALYDITYIIGIWVICIRYNLRFILCILYTVIYTVWNMPYRKWIYGICSWYYRDIIDHCWTSEMHKHRILHEKYYTIPLWNTYRIIWNYDYL